MGAVTLLPKPLSEESLVACVERIAGQKLAPAKAADEEKT